MKDEDKKFTMAAMMAFDLRNVNYAVSHSRHITSKVGYAANTLQCTNVGAIKAGGCSVSIQ